MYFHADPFSKVRCVFPMVTSHEFLKGNIETTAIGKVHPTALKFERPARTFDKKNEIVT